MRPILRSIAARGIAGEEPDETPDEYRFHRFVTTRLKLFDEREFGGAVFVTARVSRG